MFRSSENLSSLIYKNDTGCYHSLITIPLTDLAVTIRTYYD
jgi:hypothetical protein